MKFEDYIPEDEDLLCSFYSNVAYSPEGFIFDRKNPTWFLLNAESEIYTYCEPIRTGIVTLHRENPYCYMAHPYNQTIGYVIYDVCPIQNIKETGRYIDMPLEDECNASLIVNFPRWTTSVSDIDNDLDEKFEYFTIYGLKTFGLQKGINIVKRGIKISKVIY